MKGFFKKSGIYFDTKVKKGSNNAITSDAVAKAIEKGGGGGGGSTDYADLSNKPKINNVELSGNKSSSDLGIASEANLNALSDNVGNLSELTTTEKTSLVGAINDIKMNVDIARNEIGDLSGLTTTEKTSVVGAINEIAGGGGGGSDGGVKYQRFANKPTTQTTSVGGASFVAFTENNIKTWFDSVPNTIHAIIASRSGGTNVKVALKTGLSFITEQSSNAVTYDYVGVFYG